MSTGNWSIWTKCGVQILTNILCILYTGFWSASVVSWTMKGGLDYDTDETIHRCAGHAESIRIFNISDCQRAYIWTINHDQAAETWSTILGWTGHHLQSLFMLSLGHRWVHPRDAQRRTTGYHSHHKANRLIHPHTAPGATTDASGASLCPSIDLLHERTTQPMRRTQRTSEDTE